MNMLTYNIRFHYLGVAYPIHGHMRDYWNIYFYLLGAPVSNEHCYDGVGYCSSADPDYIVQWFEPSDNNYVAVVYNNNTGEFARYNQNDPGAPPLTVIDQAKWENLGCPNGECGVGGADGTEPMQGSGYEFHQAQTCKGVDSSNDWLPIDITNIFTNSDQYVYHWVELNNVYESVNLKWRWYNAFGVFMSEVNKTTTDPASENYEYYGWYRESTWWNVENQTSYGQWKVEFFINNELTDISYFQLDGCPSDPNKLAPGTCGCGTLDIDSDGDGAMDCQDNCPNDSSKINPGTCGCGIPDIDSDGDGTKDCQEECDSDPNKTSPGQCGCGVADTDSDGDGTMDCQDGCPSDAGKINPGQCGCGTPDIDSDGDGTADCHDNCPNDAGKINPGTCGCGVSDADSDGDGIKDCQDQYPNDPNNGVSSLNTPVISSVQFTGLAVTFNWLEVSGASGYRIYRTDNINGEAVFETMGLNFTDDSLEENMSYRYQIQAFYSNIVSGKTAAKCVNTTAETASECLCPPGNLRIISN